MDREPGCPPPQGLYDPRHEKDACGVGFVVHVKGVRSHAIVKQALQLLVNLLHRGACGCEVNTGDGAGILIQMPDTFLRKEARASASRCLPRASTAPDASFCRAIRLRAPRSKRWSSRSSMRKARRCSAGAICPPTIVSSARRRPPSPRTSSRCSSVRADLKVSTTTSLTKATDLQVAAFERKLYVIRKRIEHAVDTLPISSADRKYFYIPSLSANTLIYKGMLIAEQIETMFPDLTDPDVESALALVHQRFSTNTFPSWPLAHPYRYVAHNGEINTLRGNINWMHAREAMCESDLFGDDLKKILPVIREGGSDTAMFDNVLEFLVMAGRSLPHAMLMMIPEPWAGHETMSPERKAFYEYHATMMEPWDGPASIAFTDGTVIGAVLDRNGLRPSRYYVTKDDLVVMASEVGVLDIPEENIVLKGRLHPGRMFLIDTEQGRIIADEEIKRDLASQQPYAAWLNENMVALEDLKPAPLLPLPDHDTMLNRQRTFGYTQEDLRILLAPMAQNGEEAIGSMGTDTALAVLSDKPRLLYDYFKQLFAQVTNPPLDAIREELVTSMGSTIGPEANLLKPGPEACRQIKVKSAIVNNEELARLRHIDERGFKSVTLPMLFDAEPAAPAWRARWRTCSGARARRSKRATRS